MALVGTISGSNGTSNTAVTGTLVIANTAINFPSITSDAVLFVSGVIGGISKSVFSGDLVVSGNVVVNRLFTLGTTSEFLLNSSSAGSSLNFDLTSQAIFYVNNPTANIDANFLNTSATDFRVITPTIILSQSATPRIVSAIRIDGATQTINWANGIIPTGLAGKQDVFGFSLIRSGSAWKVLGQMSTFG